MSKEAQVVLVDEKDNVVGYMDKIKAHRNPAPLHRAVSIVIYSPDKKYMLTQKRAVGKPTWPLFWSNTVCTHPTKGESYIDTARRRLPEEMGFTTDLEYKYDFIYSAKQNSEIGEHELDHVFTGSIPMDTSFVPDPREAEESKWVSVQDLKHELVNDQGKFTPWFKLIFEELQSE